MVSKRDKVPSSETWTAIVIALYAAFKQKGIWWNPLEVQMATSFANLEWEEG